MATLNEIQQKLKAPKNQQNTFGDYKYRSCEDILEAVKPLLNGSTLTLTDEIVEVGGRVYVKATAIFFNSEYTNGDNNPISVTAFAREQATKKRMDEAQITGSASSYARKYALNGLFLIDDTKDPDTRKPADNGPRTVNTDQETAINDWINERDMDKAKFLSWAGVSKVEDIPAADFDRVKQAILSKPLKGEA